MEWWGLFFFEWILWWVFLQFVVIGGAQYVSGKGKKCDKYWDEGWEARLYVYCAGVGLLLELWKLILVPREMFP